MKIKRRPEDFIVTERLAVKPKPRGSFALYRVEKKSLTTHALLAEMAGALGASPRELSWGGLKDKYAQTTQHIACKRGGPPTLNGPSWQAERIGWLDEPMGSDLIEANEFKMILRDLALGTAAHLTAGFARLGRSGLPNYYDDQRLAAARGGTYMARHLLRRESELALKAWIEPAAEDRAALRLRKLEFLSHWGKFAKCLAAAETDEERAIFYPLSRDRQAFSAALNALPAETIFFQVTAYQAFLWNRLVAQAFSALPAAAPPAPSEARTKHSWGALLHNRAGDLPLPEKCPDGWETLPVPLPGKNAVFPPPFDVAAETVFAEQGLTARQFKIDKITNAHFKPSPRRLWLWPEALSFSAPEPDALHPGRHQLALSVTLPSGCYATLIIKAAAALAGEAQHELID